MITIVTATHNRAHTLERLWQSLCAQIEIERIDWLLVDDGSTDNTQQWFERLTCPLHVKTHYIRQSNQGKHVAINTAVANTRSDWVFIVDSDDAITPDAVATISRQILSFNDQADIVGLCYRKKFFDGRLVGKSIKDPNPIFLSPNAAGLLFQGDLAYIFKRTSLVTNPFPVIENERFVPELLVWNRIADQGRICFFPQKSIYFCEYLEDGYSHNFKRLLKRNPKGYGIFYRDQLKRLPVGISWIKAAVRFIQCKLFQWIKT